MTEELNQAITPDVPVTAIVPDAVEVYTKDFVEKLKQEKSAALQATREVKEQNRLMIDEKMRAENNYKGIAEAREKEANEWRNKYEQKEKMIQEAAKRSSMKKELRKLGFDGPDDSSESLLKLANFERINIDMETNVVTGAAEESRIIAQRFPQLFGVTPVGVNQASPVGRPTALTLDDWKKLPADERRKRQNELYTNLGVR